jgi:hypothetical protein
MRNMLSKEDEGLKAMLEDFLLIAEHLAPLCDDPNHMVGVVRGALADEAQLLFLANVLKRQAKK